MGFSRAIKTGILNGVEMVWAFGFAIAGKVRRAKVAAWSTPGGQRILVLAPHPDDEAIGCGGTLLKHQQQGDAVTVIYVTDGSGSRALGLSAETMAHRRQQEAMACAALLKIDDCIWLDFAEGNWSPTQLAASLNEQPAYDIIYAPSRVDFHPEHHKVAFALALSLAARSAETPLIRMYQIHTPLTATLVNLISPLAPVQPQITTALAAYVTQQESVRKAQRLQQYAARYYGAGRSAELFWQVSAETYCALHHLPLPWPQTLFRGLYPRPISDLLSFLKGRNARQQLAQKVASII